MPKTKRHVAPTGAAYLFVEDLAAARGISPASVRAAHYIASKKARDAGDPLKGKALDGRILDPAADKWPPGAIPRPDRGRPLLRWDPSREDVRAYITPPQPDPRLKDYTWLHEQYVSQGRTPSAIADLLNPKPSRDVVVLSLERVECPDGTIGIPIRTAGNTIALDGWSLADLEGALERHEGILKHAADEVGVTTMTFRRALRRAKRDAEDRQPAQ